MNFYVGIDPWHARHFERAFVTVNALRTRRKPLGCADWIMDSGAFSEVSTHGGYRFDVSTYAAIIARWTHAGSGLTSVVAQDWMCEPFILERTGLSIADHQRFTIERFDALRALVHGVHVMPVLQGYLVADYVRHLEQYGERFEPGAYVGVGSLCKRNASVAVIEQILVAIKNARPDLRLHGFGLKATALRSGLVRDALHSSDSMAWSYAARRQGRDKHDWREAQRWLDRIERQTVQCAWAF